MTLIVKQGQGFPQFVGRSLQTVGKESIHDLRHHGVVQPFIDLGVEFGSVDIQLLPTCFQGLPVSKKGVKDLLSMFLKGFIPSLGDHGRFGPRQEPLGPLQGFRPLQVIPVDKHVESQRFGGLWPYP
jgi:hypothetical protein